MKQLCEKSIQMIKTQNRKLTVREYNKLAKESKKEAGSQIQKIK